MDTHGLQNMSVAMGVWATLVGFLHIPLIVWGKRLRERTAAMDQRMMEKREKLIVSEYVSS
jgi:hypothetical protein